MPAVSEKQRKMMAAALAAKRSGNTSNLKGPAKQAAKSMSEKQLKDFAKRRK